MKKCVLVLQALQAYLVFLDFLELLDPLVHYYNCMCSAKESGEAWMIIDYFIVAYCWNCIVLLCLNLQGEGETEARGGFLGQRVRREPQVYLEGRERGGS